MKLSLMKLTVFHLHSTIAVLMMFHQDTEVSCHIYTFRLQEMEYHTQHRYY